ncbi:MAG: serine/threonine-protein kinase [Myxococcales bacterium]
MNSFREGTKNTGSALADTQNADPAGPSWTTSKGGRTTVLPRLLRPEVGPEIDLRPRYTPIRLLGVGGMGEVILAEDQDIERKVAVKKLRNHTSHAAALFRFAEEIKTIGQLEHPSIVPIHDVGIDEQGEHYFVMKYVQGDTLEQIILKLREGDPAYTARFSFPLRTRIFLAILEALRYAHAQGIIHRDIKPSNIMVGPFGEVTVMDWGLAKRIRAGEGLGEGREREEQGPLDAEALRASGLSASKLVETQAGVLLGTPLYMSPEQAQGKNDLDERSDIYSLCVLFSELLFLEHYLEHNWNVQQLLTSLASDPLDREWFRTRVMAGEVPAELGYFVVKGLHKERDRRFGSVEAMILELEEIMAGKVHVQCAVTALKRANHWMNRAIDRHKAGSVWTMLLAGLVTVGVLVVLVLQLGSRR